MKNILKTKTDNVIFVLMQELHCIPVFFKKVTHNISVHEQVQISIVIISVVVSFINSTKNRILRGFLVYFMFLRTKCQKP